MLNSYALQMSTWTYGAPLGGHELLMKYVFPVIARSTLLEGVARSTQHEALLPSQVPKTFPVIWWQVMYISQHAYIYSTIHSAVSYSNLESSLEIDRKRKGRRQKIGARRKSSHLFIRTYLCIVNEHLCNGSFDDTSGKLVLFERQCRQYGEADARTYLHLGAHVIYMPARVPHLPARLNVLASRIARFKDFVRADNGGHRIEGTLALPFSKMYSVRCSVLQARPGPKDGVSAQHFGADGPIILRTETVPKAFRVLG